MTQLLQAFLFRVRLFFISRPSQEAPDDTEIEDGNRCLTMKTTTPMIPRYFTTSSNYAFSFHCKIYRCTASETLNLPGNMAL